MSCIDVRASSAVIIDFLSKEFELTYSAQSLGSPDDDRVYIIEEVQCGV